MKCVECPSCGTEIFCDPDSPLVSAAEQLKHREKAAHLEMELFTVKKRIAELEAANKAFKDAAAYNESELERLRQHHSKRN